MDKTVSESAPVPASQEPQPPEHRLHPWSWLFALLNQLRAMVLPVIALVVFGRGDSWIWWGLVGAVGIAVYAFVYSYGFRYRIGARELYVRSGIFSRTERHVPYARIQNIVQKRNLLHRLFGVTELRLESAGGSEPEAVMSVITLEAAAELERVLRHSGAESGPEDSPLDATTPAWLELGSADLIRLGLLNDRGWVAIGAMAAVFWQFADDGWNPGRQFYRFGSELFGSVSHAVANWSLGIVAGIALVIVLWLLIKLLSMLMTVLSFHGFRLSGNAERLSTEAGLLTRHVASARRDKIQRLIIGESLLARWMGRRWLSCEVAAGTQAEANAEQQAMRLRWLAPIATESQIHAIADRVVPGLDFAQLQWQPLHPQAWRRLFKLTAFWWLLFATVPSLLLFGSWAWIPAAGVIILAWCYARGWARFAAYACDDQFIAFRAGWLHRRWTVAPISKAQTVAISHTPFDRQRGMHTVSVDTAGARYSGIGLSIPYLAIDEAKALAERLRNALPQERP
jgi:putative membrane protein